MTSMPEQTATLESTRLPIADEGVLGGDTHKDEHVAAVVTALGLLAATASFPATAAGYEELHAWAEKYGVVRRAGIEGTGSYGAALARQLRASGVTVIEVNRPDRSMRRHRGKTDAVDAEAAARAVLSGRATVTPKTGDGAVEMLRFFEIAKGPAIKARTQAINQLKGILVNAEPALRGALSGLTTHQLVTRCTALGAEPRAAAPARATDLAACPPRSSTSARWRPSATRPSTTPPGWCRPASSANCTCGRAASTDSTRWPRRPPCRGPRPLPGPPGCDGSSAGPTASDGASPSPRPHPVPGGGPLRGPRTQGTLRPGRGGLRVTQPGTRASRARAGLPGNCGAGGTRSVRPPLPAGHRMRTASPWSRRRPPFVLPWQSEFIVRIIFSAVPAPGHLFPLLSLAAAAQRAGPHGRVALGPGRRRWCRPWTCSRSARPWTRRSRKPAVASVTARTGPSPVPELWSCWRGAPRRGRGRGGRGRTAVRA